MPTTISGNIKSLVAGAITSRTIVRFTLKGMGGNQPRVNGAALIAPSGGGVEWYADAIPNNVTGAISITLYSTRDAAGTGNGEIDCGGSFTSCFYEMQIIHDGGKSPRLSFHAKNGVATDITSITPINAVQPVSAPSGDSTYVRLDGGNLSLPVNIPFSATPVYALPSAPSILTVFKITLSGNVTSSTMTGTHPGIVGFMITQDVVGGRTHAFPSNVKNFQAPDTTPNALSIQFGFFDGTNLYPFDAQTVN